MSLTGLVFLAGFLAGLGLAVFRHPRYGLYTYMAVYYLDPPTRWWGEFLPDMRWSLVAGIITLLASLRLRPAPGTPSWASTTPARLLIMFTAWLWIQNLWALAPTDHLDACVLFTKYLILFALIYRVGLSATEIGGIILVHIAGCFYLGWLTHLAPSGGRLEGVGGPGIDDANGLAMFIATGVVCASVVLLVERSWRRWLAILAMPFLLNGIVQSQSRGAMLALVCAGLVLFYLKPTQYRKHFYFFGILGLILFGMVAQATFWDRMRTLEAVDDNAQIDSSAESRVVLAQAQWRMALDYPLGAGHRGTAVLSPRYLDEKWLTRSHDDPQAAAARSSHNSFMSALVEQGFPGALIYLGLVVWTVRSIFALKRFRDTPKRDPASVVVLYAPAAAASLVVVIVAGLFTDYLKTEVQIWMFALLAVLTRVHLPRELVAARSGRAQPETLATEVASLARDKARAGLS